MIDEYLTEPHSISNEWVQALLVCKQALIDNKKKDIEIDILIRKKETLRDEITEQKAEIDGQDVEIMRLKHEIERLTKIVEEQHEGSLIAMEVYKNEAIKNLADKLYEKIEQNAKFGFDYVTKKEIENVVRELEGGKI